MPTDDEIEAAAAVFRKKIARDVPAMFRSQFTDELIAEYAKDGLEAAEKVRAESE